MKTSKTLALLLLLLCAFNRLDYNAIMLGTPAPKVVEKYGEPYAVHIRDKETKEYEYIERVIMGSELIYENHYFLTIVNSQVVGKRFTEETRPGYDQMYRFDPYEPAYP